MISAVKALTGSATQVVQAPIETCFDLLIAVESYPRWHPAVVRNVEVVERSDDGHATRARTALHVVVGPVTKDFTLVMAVVTIRPQSVTLTRIPHGPSDAEEFGVRWRLVEENSATRINLDVEANLSVPRFLPLGGVGDQLAGGFVTAAAGALGSA
jgi:ribosome-associated toxin RatA of RatAB toxin-antitoxin module